MHCSHVATSLIFNVLPKNLLIQFDLHLPLNVSSQPALRPPCQQSLLQTQSGPLLLCHAFIFAGISSDFPFLRFGGIQLYLIELPLTSSSDRDETWPAVFVLSSVILSCSLVKTIVSNSLPISGQGCAKLNLNGKQYKNGLLDLSLESLAEHQPPWSWKLFEHPRDPALKSIQLK